LRFNGFNFEEVQYFHDPGNEPVFDLMFDSRGVLWIAGKEGITSYDGSNFRYYSISADEGFSQCYGLVEAENKDLLFFYGEKSLYRLENDKPLNISSLLEPLDGSIVKVAGRQTAELKVLSSNGEIWQYKKDGFYLLPPVNPGTEQILFASDGRIYCANAEKLVLFGPKGDRYITEISTGMLNTNVIDAFRTDDGTTWISYGDKIIVVRNNQITQLNESKGYDGGTVKRLFCDSEQNIWFVTEDKGLYCYPGDVLTYLEYSENLSFTPSSFFVNKEGQLLISYFGKGVEIHDKYQVSKLTQKNGLASNYVRCISGDGDACWIITARGVTVMSLGNIISYSTSNGLPHNYCFHACADASGQMWIGTEGGVGIFGNGTFRSITLEDGLLSNRIKFLMMQKDGSMLLLSDYGIDLAREGFINRFIHEGLKNKEELNTMTIDLDGNIWIGSDINGLIFYDIKTGQVKYINQFMKVPFTRVRALTFYNDNGLCVGTERGIYYLEVTTNGNIISISSTGIEKGYPDFEVIQNAMMRVEDGIYTGTSIGVIKFNPEKIVEGPGIPVSITALKVEFKDTDWGQTKESLDPWSGTPLRPVLAYDQNDLQIDYRGISLRSKEKLWYRHQLVNYDQDWSEPSRNESVLYANLSSGKYHFKVSASHDGLNWSEAFTQYDFIISPPFWRTWWFYILVFAFMLLGFVLVNNYRIRSRVNQLLYLEKLNKEEQERIQKKVSMDFHDEVGNHLTSISLLVELIRNREWEVPKALQELLDKIDVESRNLFLGTKDFIWSIDPKNNNLKEVFYIIKDYGEEVFENTGILFHVENGISEDINVKLPAGFTRQIVLIFKEAINNAKTHAGCSKVQFSVDRYPDRFQIRLSDNGIGFNTEEIEYYNGLKKMKIRGEKIKADLIFNSGPEIGTEIILRADLYKNITS